MRTYLGPGSMAHRFRKEDAMSIFTIYHDSMMTTSIGRGPFLDRTNTGHAAIFIYKCPVIPCTRLYINAHYLALQGFSCPLNALPISGPILSRMKIFILRCALMWFTWHGVFALVDSSLSLTPWIEGFCHVEHWSWPWHCLHDIPYVRSNSCLGTHLFSNLLYSLRSR